jgi:hypothetical protein
MKCRDTKSFEHHVPVHKVDARIWLAMMLALLASPKVQHRDNELLSACTHTYTGRENNIINIIELHDPQLEFVEWGNFEQQARWTSNSKRVTHFSCHEGFLGYTHNYTPLLHTFWSSHYAIRATVNCSSSINSIAAIW